MSKLRSEYFAVRTLQLVNKSILLTEITVYTRNICSEVKGALTSLPSVHTRWTSAKYFLVWTSCLGSESMLLSGGWADSSTVPIAIKSRHSFLKKTTYHKITIWSSVMITDKNLSIRCLLRNGRSYIFALFDTNVEWRFKWRLWRSLGGWGYSDRVLVCFLLCGLPHLG